ncbi:DUF4870 domain-containing protein [Cryobacterium sp.]|jgi:uncharacterized Tic20 family protein|uniref:DUF4870 domain-containing protein n=1 Tax=Cryobacterium sp. TaxID=1926290 RepID=UPI002604181B|nr:DUF4870 domain-containing protein [Cryobacterium sp.]MCU1446821.1 hypothetical protein [Cryobacterium sp.]
MSEATPPPASPYQTPSQLSPADEKLWATLIHIGGILFSFVPALIGFIVLKDRGPFIRAHTATALNFQITMAVAGFIGGILTIVLVGFFILAAVWIVNIVFSIMAAIAANKGEWYSYPLTIKFLS